MGVAQRARGSIRRHVPIPSADDLRRAAIDAPTVRENLLPAITGPQVADETLVLRVLDLALRIGEIQLVTGAGAAVVHDTMLGVASAYGLPTCDVDIAYSTITMCCHRGLEAGPVTTMRNVRYRTQDYTRLATIDALIKDIVDRDVPLTSSEAFERLAAAVESAHPYPRYVAGIARSAFASAVAVLIGGGPGVALVTFVLTAVVWGIARYLGRRHVPMFFQQVVGAMVVTTTALALASSGTLLDSPAFVVAAGIIVLLTGLSLVGLVQDAITGFPLTAAGRVVEVVLATAGLLVGVVVSIKLAAAVGGPSALSYALAVPHNLTPQTNALSLIAAAAAGLFFALSAYAPLASLPVAAIGGAAVWAIYAVGVQTGLGQVTASAVAAAVLGLIAMLLPQRLGLPPLVLVVAGIMPLLPGLNLYTGFSQLAAEGTGANGAGTGIATGSVTILLAFTVSLGLAAGVSFGEQVGWPLAKLRRHTMTTTVRSSRPRILLTGAGCRRRSDDARSVGRRPAGLADHQLGRQQQRPGALAVAAVEQQLPRGAPLVQRRLAHRGEPRPLGGGHAVEAGDGDLAGHVAPGRADRPQRPEREDVRGAHDRGDVRVLLQELLDAARARGLGVVEALDHGHRRPVHAELGEPVAQAGQAAALDLVAGVVLAVDGGETVVAVGREAHAEHADAAVTEPAEVPGQLDHGRLVVDPHTVDVGHVGRLVADHHRDRALEHGGEVLVVVGHGVDDEAVDPGARDRPDVLGLGTDGDEQEPGAVVLARERETLQELDGHRVAERVGQCFGEQESDGARLARAQGARHRVGPRITEPACGVEHASAQGRGELVGPVVGVRDRRPGHPELGGQ